MSTPATPTLTLARASDVTFTAHIQGQAGTQHLLYYQRIGAASWAGPETLDGDGWIGVTDLAAGGQYQAFAVSRDAEEFLSLPSWATVSLNVGDSLMAAVQRKWLASPTLVEAAGRLFVEEAPEKNEDGTDLVFPYTVGIFGKTNFQPYFNGSLESNLVEFTTYTVGAEAAQAASDVIRQNFDWGDLTFLDSDVSIVKIEPVDQALRREMIRARDGAIIYTATLSYDFWTNREGT
jgi:hypothetical protein